MAVFETTVNISTKNQRRGDVIQNKWVSKNTLVNKGDLVVGTGASTGALISGDSYTDVANVNVISVGTDGYPLVANSFAALGLAYQKVGTVGIADGAVTLAQVNSSAYATTADNFVQNPARLATGTSLMSIWDSTSGIHFAPNSQSMTVSAYINNGAVGTAQIADAAITGIKLNGFSAGKQSSIVSSYSITAQGLYSFYVPSWQGSHGNYPGDQLVFSYDYNLEQSMENDDGAIVVGHCLGKVLNYDNGAGYSIWTFTPVKDVSSGRYLSLTVTLSYYVAYYNGIVDTGTSFYASALLQY